MINHTPSVRRKKRKKYIKKANKKTTTNCSVPGEYQQILRRNKYNEYEASDFEEGR